MLISRHGGKGFDVFGKAYRLTASKESEPSSSHPKPSMYGVLCIFAASLLWSTSGFFARAPQLNLWSLEERGAALAFWRALFALTLMVPWIRRPRFVWGMLPMVLFFSFMNWTYLTALVTGPPANAIWLQNLAPVWVMLVGVFFFREKAILRDWWMLGCCTFGVLFILVFQILQSEGTGGYAAWLGLLSGVCYAGVVLSLRYLRQEDSAWLIALNHVATAAMMAPFALMGPAIPSGSTWLLLIAFGMLQMGLPYLLFAQGLRTTPGHLASVLTLLEPILLPVWIHLAWRHAPDYQPPTWWTLIGGGFILLGLLIRFLPWNSKNSTTLGKENAT